MDEMKKAGDAFESDFALAQYKVRRQDATRSSEAENAPKVFQPIQRR
jgi:hypothetical protein